MTRISPLGDQHRLKPLDTGLENPMTQGPGSERYRLAKALEDGRYQYYADEAHNWIQFVHKIERALMSSMM